jgi:DinB superfamily
VSTTTTSAGSFIATRTKMIHQQTVDLASGLSDDQFAWQPRPGAPAINWHLWHIARFADIVQSTVAPSVGRPGEQIWERDGLHGAWGMPGVETLGWNSTGMGMADDATADLPLPAHGLREYARRAFEAADAVCAALNDSNFDAQLTDYFGKSRLAGDVMLGHLTHASRHLGSMEALKGALGLEGSVSG